MTVRQLRLSSTLALAPGNFSHTHIALTALTTAAICGVFAAVLLRGRARLLEGLPVTAISGLAVYLWRASANMPQLNNDGLPGYSANDWLAPIIVFVALTLYADLRPPADLQRYRRVRALATIAAFAVNVITA